MSGLQLATKTPTPDRPASPPPPIPAAGPQNRDLGSHTQEDYSLPPPGASPEVGSTPPPPPSPVHESALPGQGEIVEPDDERGSKIGAGLAVILVLGVLGAGGWYLVQHTGLFAARGTVRQPVSWPILQLTGMVDAQNIGDASSAILNGNLVALNHRIDGATLVEVSSDGVVLELNGERKMIRIGESTTQ